MTPGDRRAIDLDPLVGGRTDTVTELRSMAAEAGLAIVAATRQPNGRFMVGCVPVGA